MMMTKQNIIIGTSVGLFFIVGLALRLYLLTLPYWFDEANTIYYVSQNFDRMMQFIQHDYSPPLYYLLLWLWMNFFGSSEITTGLFSFIINLLSVIVLYVFASTLANKRVALMASLLFWLNSASVYYATETRMYALVTLLGLLSCLFFWQLMHKPKWYYWVGYYLATLAGVYTHNTFFFLLVGQNFVWALMRWQYSNQPVSSKRWLAVQLLLFLGYLGWLPTFLQQLFSNSQGSVYWTDYAAWKGILAVPEILFASISNFGFPIANLILVVLISFIVYHFFAPNSYADSKFNQIKVFLAVLVFIPLSGAYLANMLMPKFVVIVFPLFVIILAIGIDRIRFDFFKKYIILAVFLFSSSLILFTNNISLQESNLGFMMPKVAHYFAATKNTDHTIILFNGYPEKVLFDYYYQGNIETVGAFPRSLTRSNDLEISQVIYNGQAIFKPSNVQEIDQLISGHKTVWLVLTTDWKVYDPANLVERRLLQLCRVKHTQYFPEDDTSFEHIKVIKLNNCSV